nr:YcaO-like family protein [Priestia flexa]
MNTKHTRLSLTPPFVDTTGTAAHPISNNAVFNAVSELIEKNSIFLFWYGKMGRKVNNIYPCFYSNYLIKQGYKLHHFLIDYFMPFKVIITIALSEKTPLKFKFGIGSSLDFKSAIHKSLAETYLLGSYYEVLYYNTKNQHYDIEEQEEIEKFNDKEILNYIYKIINNCNIYNIQNEKSFNIEKLYKNLPIWIKQLLIVNLPQFLREDLIVVKAFSPQLLNCIPKKSHIDINVEINKQTLDLKKQDLANIPDCPII